MNKLNFNNVSDHILQASDIEQITNSHRITLIRRAKKSIAPQPIKIGGRWYWFNSKIQAFISGKWEAVQ
jgi:predicted DNA-binding transcriptional regulator AlpA